MNKWQPSAGKLPDVSKGESDIHIYFLEAKDLSTVITFSPGLLSRACLIRLES